MSTNSSSDGKVLDDHIRKQIVVLRLTQFYRTYDPRQVPLAEKKFDEHASRLEDLFNELIRRYPRCPKDFFDEVKSTLQGLDSAVELKMQSSTAAATTSSQHAVNSQIANLLREGEELLAAPAPQVFGTSFNNNENRDDGDDDDRSETASRISGYSHQSYTSGTHSISGEDALELEATSQGHLDDMRILKQLIEENRALASDVAMAEQQVLQKRFEVMFLKYVVTPTNNKGGSNSSKTTTSSSVPTFRDPKQTLLQQQQPHTLIIQDEHREFHVPCSDAEKRFVVDGPLSAPWSLDDRDHCVVLFRRPITKQYATSVSRREDVQFELDEPKKVVRGVLAMAMRVWSRLTPHTVVEVLPTGELLTHPSTVLWWQWPNVCEQHRGVEPESLMSFLTVYNAPLPTTSSPGKRVRVAHQHEEVQRLLTNIPRQTQLSSSSGSEADTLNSNAFWIHFMQQVRQLSSNAGTDSVL